MIVIQSFKSSKDFLFVTSKTKTIPSICFIVFNAIERNLSCPDVSHMVNLISFPLSKHSFFSNLSWPTVGRQSESNSLSINDLMIEVLPTSASPKNPILILEKSIFSFFPSFCSLLF